MYDLEIATDSDKLRQTEYFLKRTFPALDLIGKSRFFCIWGTVLPASLTEQQKATLEQWREATMIYRWRCGKQKEGQR